MIWRSRSSCCLSALLLVAVAFSSLLSDPAAAVDAGTNREQGLEVDGDDNGA